jgi:hypothetical protein
MNNSKVCSFEDKGCFVIAPQGRDRIFDSVIYRNNHQQSPVDNKGFCDFLNKEPSINSDEQYPNLINNHFSIVGGYTPVETSPNVNSQGLLDPLFDQARTLRNGAQKAGNAFVDGVQTVSQRISDNVKTAANTANVIFKRGSQTYKNPSTNENMYGYVPTKEKFNGAQQAGKIDFSRNNVWNTKPERIGSKGIKPSSMFPSSPRFKSKGV